MFWCSGHGVGVEGWCLHRILNLLCCRQVFLPSTTSSFTGDIDDDSDIDHADDKYDGEDGDMTVMALMMMAMMVVAMIALLSTPLSSFLPFILSS